MLQTDHNRATVLPALHYLGLVLVLHFNSQVIITHGQKINTKLRTAMLILHS